MDFPYGFVGECVEFCKTGRRDAETENVTGGMKDGRGKRQSGEIQTGETG